MLGDPGIMRLEAGTFYYIVERWISYATEVSRYR